MTRAFSANPFQLKDNYKYQETIASSFGSSLFCMSPVYYQGYMHKDLVGKLPGYTCSSDNLPYEEFPGWDDEL